MTLTDSKRPFTIGVAGGSGSGKTTASITLIEKVDRTRITYIPHDSYYRDWDDVPLTDDGNRNFDHPDALDTILMTEHIRQLQAWKPVDIPVYDFKTYMRTGETERLEPNPIILVEGILIFVEPALRALFDFRIFVDTDSDLRFIRRLERDIRERDRSVESVIDQYLRTVRPMHQEFVEPTRRYADIIIPEMRFAHPAIDMIADRIRMLTMHSG